MSRAREAARETGLFRIQYMAARSRAPLRSLSRWGANRHLARFCTRTLVSYDRLRNAQELGEAAVREGTPGAFVECGVWKGGVAALLAMVAREENRGRLTHLFDSFEGLPQPTEEDGHRADGYPTRARREELRPVHLYAADLASVEQWLFGPLGLSRAAVRIHKGWFQEVLPRAAPEIGDISLLRIDADWYESVKVCLECLYDRVVPGGYVILDDYGGYPGCRRAWDEFAVGRGIHVPLNVVDSYGVWLRKA
ncbi:MAG TPA: TylF/MycF/NovP-related O-methyltransferase [Vicinamibacteria bacterium]|nr:TylF/MycF/NovP-related O-methyltransferase [Vicinamibacteria bacterium]